jgi:hypothetical protein
MKLPIHVKLHPPIRRCKHLFAEHQLKDSIPGFPCDVVRNMRTSSFHVIYTLIYQIRRSLGRSYRMQQVQQHPKSFRQSFIKTKSIHSSSQRFSEIRWCSISATSFSGQTCSIIFRIAMCEWRSITTKSAIKPVPRPAFIPFSAGFHRTKFFSG